MLPNTMSSNTIKATLRFVTDHHAGFTKFFTPACEGPEMSAAEVHVLVGLINAAQENEGAWAIYGTRSLTELGDAWTNLERHMGPYV